MFSLSPSPSPSACSYASTSSFSRLIRLFTPPKNIYTVHRGLKKKQKQSRSAPIRRNMFRLPDINHRHNPKAFLQPSTRAFPRFTKSACLPPSDNRTSSKEPNNNKHTMPPVRNQNPMHRQTLPVPIMNNVRWTRTLGVTETLWPTFNTEQVNSGMIHSLIQSKNSAIAYINRHRQTNGKR